MGNRIMRSPRSPTKMQLANDKGNQKFKRTVKNKSGKTHRQGVMSGSKYGYRAGQAKIGSKTVEYYSDRRGKA